MKTTERFDRAVTKLYNAFHNGTLDAQWCSHCAVGNMIGHAGWICGGSIYLDEPANKPNNFKLDTGYTNDTGYSLEELAEVEFRFIRGVGYEGYWNDGKNKDHQFKGLCAVVSYLAEIDGIPDPMEFHKYFEVEDGKPKHELTLETV